MNEDMMLSAASSNNEYGGEESGVSMNAKDFIKSVVNYVYNDSTSPLHDRSMSQAQLNEISNVISIFIFTQSKN
jgi:hypothetical protein